VAEGYVVETHVALQGNKRRFRSGGISPCPEFGMFFAGRESAVAVFPHIDKFDGSFVRLRFLFHGVKNTLRSGESCQEEISLLGKLIDRHCGLADKYQVDRKSTRIR